MTIYTAVCSTNGAMVARIQDEHISFFHEYFTGYDFMGSANWSTDTKDAILMDLEEAEQIADDLTAGE